MTKPQYERRGEALMRLCYRLADYQAKARADGLDDVANALRSAANSCRAAADVYFAHSR